MKRILFIALAVTLVTFLGCSSDNPTEPQKAKLPTVTTAAVSAIAQTTAACGGTIISDGGATVTARGVCWSTGLTPTVSDSKTTDGTGTGSFSSSITGLTANTPYYIRAYATNSVGTNYGSARSFTTSAVPNTVTDIDGNVYQTITIGTQVWMAENLKVTHYRNGDPITNGNDSISWSNTSSGAYCNYQAGGYGLLYNGYAVNDSRNIAPAGYHVPTSIEWQTLTHFLGDSTVAGAKLKEAGTAHWNSPNYGATNSSGFTALPGGWRLYNGTFLDPWGAETLGRYAYFWSTPNGDWISLWVDRPDVYTANGLLGNGFSVRCIRD